MNQHVRYEQDPRAVRSRYLPEVVDDAGEAIVELPGEARADRPRRRSGQPSPARTRRQRIATMVRFATVGVSGILVNQLVLWLWVAGGDHHYLLGAVVATQGSSTWNFCLTERWVFPAAGSRRLGGGSCCSLR